MRALFYTTLFFFSLFHSGIVLCQSDVEFVDSDTQQQEVLNIDPSEELEADKKFYKKLRKKHVFKKVKDEQALREKEKAISIHDQADKKNLEALLKQVQKENSAALQAFGDKKQQQKLRDAIRRGDREAMLRQLRNSGAIPDMKRLMKKGEAKKEMQRILRPFRKLGYWPVYEMLGKEKPGNKAAKFFNQHPKIRDIVTKLLIDKRALPEAMSIIEKRAQLTIVLLINIALFVLSIILARFKKRYPFFSMQRLFYFIFRIVLITGLRVGSFAIFFHKELAPLYYIIKASL